MLKMVITFVKVFRCFDHDVLHVLDKVLRVTNIGLQKERERERERQNEIETLPRGKGEWLKEECLEEGRFVLGVVERRIWECEEGCIVWKTMSHKGRVSDLMCEGYQQVHLLT